MPHDTDERLRSRLDTNQLAREELCLGLLSLDPRFSEVRPRQPRGGPDGGRDLDAVYRGAQRAAGAVGFVNKAGETAAQKRTIKAKFEDDAAKALKGEPRPDVFVFFTNLELTLTAQDGMRRFALSLGYRACEIFDRAVMRAMLDSADGFALRFQYLNLPLSEAEQTSFFAKWGDGIHSLVSSSFQRVEQTLERLLFLQEAGDVLHSLQIHFELDRPYPAAEIGHFRAFIRMFLREPKHGIYQILFGASDKQMRFRGDNGTPTQEPAGIKAGISGGAWVQRYSDEDEEGPAEDDDTDPDSAEEAWEAAGSSSSVGLVTVAAVEVRYQHSSGFVRIGPHLALRDLEDAGWIVLMNAALAEKVCGIHVYANGYKLDDIRAAEWRIEGGRIEPKAPLIFTDEELGDPWVRLRPPVASFFTLGFSDKTPVRIFSSDRTNAVTDYLRAQRTTHDAARDRGDP